MHLSGNRENNKIIQIIGQSCLLLWRLSKDEQTLPHELFDANLWKHTDSSLSVLKKETTVERKWMMHTEKAWAWKGHNSCSDELHTHCSEETWAKGFPFFTPSHPFTMCFHLIFYSDSRCLPELPGSPAPSLSLTVSTVKNQWTAAMFAGAHLQPVKTIPSLQIPPDWIMQFSLLLLLPFRMSMQRAGR